MEGWREIVTEPMDTDNSVVIVGSWGGRWVEMEECIMGINGNGKYNKSELLKII